MPIPLATDRMLSWNVCRRNGPLAGRVHGDSKYAGDKYGEDQQQPRGRGMRGLCRCNQFQGECAVRVALELIVEKRAYPKGGPGNRRKGLGSPRPAHASLAKAEVGTSIALPAALDW